MKAFLIIILLTILSIQLSAQIKIGDITIPDSLAKEYFLDCWKNPNIIGDWYQSHWISKNEYRWMRHIKYHQKILENWNDTSDQIMQYEVVEARKATAEDFVKWMIRKKRK